MSSKKVNLFVVGAMKAGTTSLTKLLESNENIFVCPIKEPNFFIADLPRSLIDNEDYSNLNSFLQNLRPDSKKHFAHVKSAEQYQNLFKFSKHERYLAECSTLYLHSKESAQKIKAYNPDAKIIILIRNPVNRAFSHYKMDFGKGRINKSFEEAWQTTIKEDSPWSYYRMSMYADSIKNYIDLFKANNVKVIRTEDFTHNMNFVCKSLEEFLGIPFKNVVLTVENKSIKPSFPVLNKLMYKLRLKKIISKLFPGFLLTKAKNIFYTDESVHLNSDTYKRLICVFEDDTRKCEQLTNYTFNYKKA